MSYNNKSIKELHELLVNKEISALELTKATLSDISAREPQIDAFLKITEEKKEWLKKYVPFIEEKNWIIITRELNEYSSENRDIIKAQKIKELKEQYDYSILLDDDHKILKEAQKMLDTKFSPFHISSTLI